MHNKELFFRGGRGPAMVLMAEFMSLGLQGMVLFWETLKPLGGALLEEVGY